MSHNHSYWESEHYFENVDLTIVGAGIVGLNAGIRSLELNPDQKILILERSSIPSGASTRNAGFACFGSPTELLEDLKTFEQKQVFELFALRYRGIKALLNRLDNRNIDYQNHGGSELLKNKDDVSQEQINFLNNQIEQYTGLKDYYQFNSTLLNQSKLKGFDALIHNDYEACINPMKMIDALLQIYLNLGGKILYSSEVIDWVEAEKHVEIKLQNKFIFNSKQILFAVNGFAERLFPNLDIRAARNQVLLIKPKEELTLKGCYHYNRGYIYFRSVGGNLLIGGARNVDIDSEYSDQMDKNEKITTHLLQFVEEHIIQNQKFEVLHHWVGILGLGSERVPIIKKMSERIGVSVRLSGVGIAIGTLIGNNAAEMMNN
ncbi:MAG: FAD-binding oxidoreductase [Saprospiraceae bacterium]